MSNYLQVLESPLTRDRLTLIPQDKKAIALSILKLRKNPSDTHSKSVIRERINATGDHKEKRELERILSFAECPVYSDTQKGYLEMAQNIGLHWANKIIAKHSEAAIEAIASESKFDLDDKKTHSKIKTKLRQKLDDYHLQEFGGKGNAELAKTGAAIAQKLKGLDEKLPLQDAFGKSTSKRFSDYINENFDLIKEEISAWQEVKQDDTDSPDDNWEPDATYMKKLDQSLKTYSNWIDREEQREKRIPLVNHDPSDGIAKGHDYKSYTEKDKLKFRSNWMDNSDFDTDEESDDDLERWIQFADEHGWDAEDIDVKLGWA